MSDEINEWVTGTGLALDGAKVEVTGMEFGFNANIPGAVCANFVFTPLDGGEDMDQSFSVGKGWENSRDGRELVPENGKKRPVNSNSNYGRLIDSAVALVGIDNMAEVFGDTPRNADIWLGTMWRVGTVKVMVTNPTTNAEKEKDAFIFTEYLGKSIDADAEKTQTKASGAAKASGASKSAGARTNTRTSGNGIPEGIGEELWEQLLTLARESDDHDAFMEKAFDIEEVEENKAAKKAVASTKAGSVWAAK